jgi:hypothetical protein
MNSKSPESLPMDSPLDDPTLQSKARALLALCLIMVGSTLVFFMGAFGVVQFALNGVALPRNGAVLAGIPILTVVGAVVSLTALASARILVPVLTHSGLKAIAWNPVPAVEDGTLPQSESERLLALFARGKFIEYGLAEGAAIACAVMYHLSADWLLMGFAMSMVLFMVVSLPTLSRVRAWFEVSLPKLDSEKQAVLDDLSHPRD